MKIGSALVGIMLWIGLTFSAGPANATRCEKVNGGTVCEQTVPGMRFGVSEGQRCTNIVRHKFGLNSAGQPMVCAPSAYTANSGIWSAAPPIFGVQPVGGACPSWIGGAAAQSPDGRSMICEYGVGWILYS